MGSSSCHSPRGGPCLPPIAIPEALAAQADEVQLARGDNLFCWGGTVEKLYFVQHGELAAVRPMADGGAAIMFTARSSHPAANCARSTTARAARMLDGRQMGLPQVPARPRAQAPAADELSRRPPPQPDTPVDTPCRLDLTFDLSPPLPPQLEAAKFRLVSRAAEPRRLGHAAPRTVANQRARWTQMLRLLETDETCNEEDMALLREAQAMTRGGYREIPRLAESGTDTK